MLGPRLEVKARSVKRNRMGVTLGWSHATSCTHIHTHTLNYTYTNTHTHRRVYYVLMLQRMIYNLRIGRHSYRCWFLRGLMFSQFAIGPTSLLRETGIAALLTPHITHLWIHSPVNVLLVMMLCFQPLFVIEISWEVIIQFVWNMADR